MPFPVLRRATLATALIASVALLVPVAPAAAKSRHYSVDFSTVIGGKPGGIAVDQLGHRAYVIDNSADATSGSLVVLGPEHGRILKRVHVSSYASAITIDSGRHRAYVANSQDGSVTVVSTRTNKVVRTTVVGGDPTGIAVDPGLRRVYVSNLANNTITVLSQKTNKVVTTFTTSAPTGAITVDRTAHRIYAAVFNSFSPGQLEVRSGATGRLVRTVDVQDFPSAVVIDSVHHRGYASSQSNSISAFDTKTGAALPPIDVDSATVSLAIDTVAGVLYAVVGTNYDGQPGDAVAVINLKTGAIMDTVDVASDGTGSGTPGLAADTHTHSVWESGSAATTGTVTLVAR